MNPFFDNLAHHMSIQPHGLQQSENLTCAAAFEEILILNNNEKILESPSNPLLIMYVSSGKAVNDLGIYNYCQRSQDLTSADISLEYVLVTIQNEENPYQ
mmetsp:Transcript_11718/g.11637  ORF Transcript_11718/g.11637 Transcript_11718/m.11637 type:complete len:100 (+) Transcript_11718:67-366(+)